MGFNSVIMILNDRLGEIKRDEKFGEKVEAQLGLHCSDLHSKYSSNGGFSVVAQHHADNTSIILVGGNTHKVIDIVGREGHDWCLDGEKGEAGIIDILKEVAKDYGYKLTKMNDREKRNNSWRKPYKGRGWAM